MQVSVLPFGALKDWLGASQAAVEIPDGASVAQLLDLLQARLAESVPVSRSPSPARLFAGIAVSVNAQYALASHVLHEGDEVGLLPPVSGGSEEDPSRPSPPANTFVALTRDPIDAEILTAAARHGEDGAVVVFHGIVRNNSRGRQTLHLDYEAYEQMALNQLKQLAAQARERFAVRHATLVHRLGRLAVGQTSVLIVVASAHRAQAFEACRWLIDTLKKTVPIWKKETFADGAVWADGEPFPADLAVAPQEASHES